MKGQRHDRRRYGIGLKEDLSFIALDDFYPVPVRLPELEIIVVDRVFQAITEDHAVIELPP